MFDASFTEFLLIFVIALIILGPERLPKVAAQVGRWVGKARRTAMELRRQLEREVNLNEISRPKPPPPPKPGPAKAPSQHAADEAPTPDRTTPDASPPPDDATDAPPAPAERIAAETEEPERSVDKVSNG